MKELKELKFAETSDVYIEEKTKTPYCKHHGAMNKMTNFEDQSGIWRCLSVVSKKEDTKCRTGCIY